MWSDLVTGLFNETGSLTFSFSSFILCMVFAIVAGFILAFAFTFKNTCNKSFVITLTTLPAIVCAIIIMVNGNIGTGVAVAGVFSLVRFRSIPGTAREIGSIFISMGAGLIIGMGFLVYGIVFCLILSGLTLILNNTKFAERKSDNRRTMKVTIPEDLNYTTIFEEIFEKYTTNNKIEQVKTTNMGSMFKITYDLCLKNIGDEKEFIDALRTRNGNLEITISNFKSQNNEL